ncbi:MAG: MexH family multidrug efflux RND transporter periplasmic adaptor subunit [Candidatus Hydrogenedentota bacterium]
MVHFRNFMVLACIATTAAAQNQAPAAKVVVQEVARGTLQQTTTKVGNAFFKEVASLATEVSGKVISVQFEEGDRIGKGTVLVELDHTLLDANLRAAEAAVKENKTRLEQEQVRLARAETLLQDQVTTQQDYDDIRFTVDSLAHRVEAFQAEAERIREEITKKNIVAPFDGIVLQRETEIGEWKNIGDTIAVFARSGVFDVVVNVPETTVPFVRPEATAPVRVAGATLVGNIVAVIPKGDTVSRTFPVKIRLDHPGDVLMEGMSVEVDLPVGSTIECATVPRDAVLLEGRDNAVYAVVDSKAKRIPVKVLGYEGLTAGVEGAGLAPGLKVIVKGHERIKDGQPVEAE